MQSQPPSAAKAKEEPSSEPYWSEVAVAAGIQAGTVLFCCLWGVVPRIPRNPWAPISTSQAPVVHPEGAHR